MRGTADIKTPGQQLEIRPIGPSDKAALAAAVERSSDDAVYSRFLNLSMLAHAGPVLASTREGTEVRTAIALRDDEPRTYSPHRSRPAALPHSQV